MIRWWFQRGCLFRKLVEVLQKSKDISVINKYNINTIPLEAYYKERSVDDLLHQIIADDSYNLDDEMVIKMIPTQFDYKLQSPENRAAIKVLAKQLMYDLYELNSDGNYKHKLSDEILDRFNQGVVEIFYIKSCIEYLT